MADYTTSKGLVPGADGTEGGLYPEGAIATTWMHLEPLITPEAVKEQFLWGIPLVSGMRDPESGKVERMGIGAIKERIRRAVAIVETDTSLDIFPRQYIHKLAFDRFDYASFGFLKLPKTPVASIESMTIMPANNTTIFTIPLDWIETANMAKGQISLIPIGVGMVGNTGVVTGDVTGGAAAGSYFLSVLGQQPWIPAYWGITYTTGFKNAEVPVIFNELIGTIAAILVLSDLAATYAKSTSASLGIDGGSQSVGTPGPQLFDTKIALLTESRKSLTKKLKNLYGLHLFTGSI